MLTHAASGPIAAPRPRLAERAEGWLVAEWSRWPLWLPVAMGAGVLAYFGLRTEPDPA